MRSSAGSNPCSGSVAMPTHGRSTAVPPSCAIGRSSALRSFTAASTAWLGCERRGRMTHTWSSLIAAMRSSSRSALRRRSSTRAMVVAGAGPLNNACSRSTRRSSRINTASRPSVARAMAVSRSRSRSSSSRIAGEAASGPALKGGRGGSWAVTKSREVEVLQVEAVGARRQAAADEDVLLAAELRVVEEVEERRVGRGGLVRAGHDEDPRLQAPHLAVLDDDRHLPARKLDERAHGEDAHRRDELLDERLVEELAAP